MRSSASAPRPVRHLGRERDGPLRRPPLDVEGDEQLEEAGRVRRHEVAAGAAALRCQVVGVGEGRGPRTQVGPLRDSSAGSGRRRRRGWRRAAPGGRAASSSRPGRWPLRWPGPSRRAGSRRDRAREGRRRGAAGWGSRARRGSAPPPGRRPPARRAPASSSVSSSASASEVGALRAGVAREAGALRGCEVAAAAGASRARASPRPRMAPTPPLSPSAACRGRPRSSRARWPGRSDRPPAPAGRRGTW